MHFDLLDQRIFLGILLQFVPDCPNDIFNLIGEQILQRIDRNRCLLIVELLELLLLIQNCDHMSIVISVFFGSLAVVQIDEHVSQVLVQS